MELFGGGEGEYRDNFDINKVIDKYQSEFGKGCIEILLYEDLRENPDRFYTRLSDVLEVNKNVLFGLMSKGGVYRQRALTDSGVRRKKIGIVEYLYPRFRITQTRHEWSFRGGAARLLLTVLRRVNRYRLNIGISGFTEAEKAEVKAYYSRGNEEVLGQYYPVEILKKYGYIRGT